MVTFYPDRDPASSPILPKHPQVWPDFPAGSGRHFSRTARVGGTRLALFAWVPMQSIGVRAPMLCITVASDGTYLRARNAHDKAWASAAALDALLRPSEPPVSRAREISHTPARPPPPPVGGMGDHRLYRAGLADLATRAFGPFQFARSAGGDGQDAGPIVSHENIGLPSAASRTRNDQRKCVEDLPRYLAVLPKEASDLLSSSSACLQFWSH